MSVALSPFLLLADPPHERLHAGWAIVFVAVFLVLDIGLTFVVPALALTTRSVSDAFYLRRPPAPPRRSTGAEPSD